MPYLITKNCGTRTPVDIGADEARRRAESFHVVQIDGDGREIGPVDPVRGTVSPAVEHAIDVAMAAIADADQKEVAEVLPAQEFQADQPAAAPAKKAAKKKAS